MGKFNAHVHYNQDNSLAIIDNLLEHEFGVTTKAEGSCLIAQAVYAIWSQTGIPIMDLVKHIDKYTPRNVDLLGHTLSEIMSTFHVPIKTAGGYVSIDVEAFKYHSIEGVVDAVLDGTPVIFIFPSASIEAMIGEAMQYGDGEVRATTIRGATEIRFHAMLCIGAVKDELPFLIMRESRHEYGYKGYLKINGVLLQEYFHNIMVLSINVTELEAWVTK